MDKSNAINDLVILNDKEYTIGELIYQYDFNDCNYENSKELPQILLELINNKFESPIGSESEFDLILKLIEKYLFLEIKFNKKFDILSIDIWFKNIKTYLISKKCYSKYLKFLKYSFNNFSHKGLREFLLSELEKLESDIVEYVDKSSFNVIENIYFDLAEVFRLSKNEKKSQIYFKKEIDLILSYCNMFQTKDMSLSFFIIKAIEISKNKTLKDSYKWKELKKLFSQFSLDVNNHLQPMMSDKENEELYQSHYPNIKIEFQKINTHKNILTYLFLDFIHFSFLDENILKINRDDKVNFDPLIDNFGIGVYLSHYGRCSIKNIQSSENFSYDLDFRFFTELNNRVLVNLDYEFHWISKIEDEVIKYIESLQIIEPQFKQQSILAIKSFNEKNYMTFCHLSLPIIEHILRNYLNKIFGDTLNGQKPETVEFKTLGGILKAIEENENNYIDKGIVHLFKYILAEPDCMNFRNIILHGFMPENGFNKWNSMYILTVFLYLIVYFKNDEE